MARRLIRWSIEDYHRMMEIGLLAGRQVEMINGQIIDMPPELPIHRVTHNLAMKLAIPAQRIIYWLIEVSNSTLAYDLGERA
jgi:hypothetical protein